VPAISAARKPRSAIIAGRRSALLNGGRRNSRKPGMIMVRG